MKFPLLRSRLTLPLALLLLTLLAYGLLLPRLGFYWDDWPWVWTAHHLGPAGMLQIDRAYRPLSGVILWLGALLAGETPFGWQLLNLVYRWLTGLAFVWAFGQVFPARRQAVLWAGLLFLVYPGFTQQFVSVNTSRHLLSLAVFLLSLGLMLRALLRPQASRRLTLAALLCSAASLLATDYYFGLELLRPLLLWLALPPRAGRLRAALRRWLPYLLLFAGAVAWRYLITPVANYDLQLVEEVASQPSAALGQALRQAAGHVAAADVLAWANLLQFPASPEIRFRRVVGYWLLVGGAFLAAWLFLQRQPSDPDPSRIWKPWIAAGVWASLVAVLPFLAAGIPLGLAFPADRTTLPLAVGASLLLTGLLAWTARWRIVPITLVSLLVALSIGYHFAAAARYEADWQTQAAFFRQLSLRAPALRPDTAVVYEYTGALRDFRSTANSLTAPLNWMYAGEFRGPQLSGPQLSGPHLSGPHLPYFLIDARQKSAAVYAALESGQPLRDTYAAYTFAAPPQHLLVIHFAPPACLQVLSPQAAGLYPRLPDALAGLVRYSNPALIDSAPAAPVQPLPAVFGPPPAPDWCDYFQMAELARQQGDWPRVAALGDLAFSQDPYPRQPLERLPYIIGYAQTGDWPRALELTLETRRQDGNAAPLLCAAWDELLAAPASPPPAGVLAQVQAGLDCRDE
jgi:hypothetical protein